MRPGCIPMSLDIKWVDECDLGTREERVEAFQGLLDALTDAKSLRAVLSDGLWREAVMALKCGAVISADVRLEPTTGELVWRGPEHVGALKDGKVQRWMRHMISGFGETNVPLNQIGVIGTATPCAHLWRTRTDIVLASNPPQMEKRCSKCDAISYTVVGVADPPQPKCAPPGTWDTPWPGGAE